MKLCPAPFVILYLLSLALARPVGAQTSALVSPLILPDHHVTFSVHAPKASEVAVFGDWMQLGTEKKMEKDAGGNWSATLGPLPPGIYIYTFTVDGLTIADPVNPRVKLRARTSASLLEVPGHPPGLW